MPGWKATREVARMVGTRLFNDSLQNELVYDDNQDGESYERQFTCSETPKAPSLSKAFKNANESHDERN
jgi:hypothetical protein